MERRETRRSRKKRKSSFEGGRSADWIYKILLSVAVIAAVVLVVTVFFKVTTIRVEGAVQCLPEQIRDASGIQTGDKLLFIDKSAVVASIREQQPYVDQVKVRRIPPNTVVLEIEECKRAAVVEQNGAAYVIDRNAKLLEWMPSAGSPDLPVITGLTVTDPVPGRTLTVDDELYLESLLDVLDGVLDGDLPKAVTEVDLSKLYDISFTYDGRFKVKIGDTEDLPQKMTFLNAVVDRLEPTDKGVIDVADPTSAWFRPDYTSKEQSGS